MVLALLPALLGFTQDAPKLDLASVLRGDLSTVERAWGQGAETFLVPGEIGMSLDALRAMTAGRATGMPGAMRTSLTFGEAQSSKGAVRVEFVGGQSTQVSMQLFGSDVGWKTVLARLDAPAGKLWWDPDSGRSSSRDIAVRLDIPEAQGWKLELNEYRFYDEDGMKYMTSFTASRSLVRSPSPAGWYLDFDEMGAFQSARGGMEAVNGIEAAAKRLGIEAGAYDETNKTPEWMPPGTRQVVLTPKNSNWGGFVVTLTIEGEKVVAFAVGQPSEDEN